MTGLYLREMLSHWRRLLKRILIVPPAGLVGNWQSELSTLFSLQFEVISGKDARPLRWKSFHRSGKQPSDRERGYIGGEPRIQPTELWVRTG